MENQTQTIIISPVGGIGRARGIFNRIVSAVTLTAFMVTGVIDPTVANAATTVTIAPASGVTSTWASYSAQPNNWVSMPNAKGYGTNVSWPKCQTASNTFH